jgi:hypothetical protein
VTVAARADWSNEKAAQDDNLGLLERVAQTQSMEVGAALVASDHVGEAVLGMVQAGASSEDVLSGLVMAGMLRRRQRLADRLPVVGRLLARRSIGYERVLPHDAEVRPS